MEDRQAVDLPVGTHTFSPSLLSDALVTPGTEDQTGKPFQTVSFGCSVEKVTMLLCIWLTPTSGSKLSRPFEGGKLACSRKSGDWEGEEEQCRCQKTHGVYQPWGLLASG